MKKVNRIRTGGDFAETPLKDKGLRLSAPPAKQGDSGFDPILSLYGDELSSMCIRLRQFKKNKEKFSMADTKLPNYLWVAAKQDEEISTCLNAFAEFLHAEKIISFAGVVKYFCYRLSYVQAEKYFSELSRLHNVISKIAGHNRSFKGVALIDITEWSKFFDQRHFTEFLQYISSRNDEILTILYLDTDNEMVVENIQASLAVYMRIETIKFRMPSVDKLHVFVVDKYLKQNGFHLSKDAKALVKTSIQEIVDSNNSRGITTIKHFAESIIFNVLASNTSSHEISANMISDLNFKYVKRLKNIVSRTNIGFVTSK